MKKTLLPVVLLALAGCGPLNQDPMWGHPDPVREGRPPNQKPEPPRPVQSDAVIVDAPWTVSFMELRTDKIQLGSRVLVEGHKPARIRIVNPEAFPGATFDEATSEFVWTPEKGVVFSGLSREIVLQIVAESEPLDPEKPALIATREIRVTVHRRLGIPEVRAIETSSSNFREGSTFYVNVKVADPDAGMGAGEEPKLVIQPSDNRGIKSLAALTTISSRSFNSQTGLWNFNLAVDLSDQEVTKSVVRGGFRVQAINRFNQVSTISTFETKVYTKLTALASTWGQEIQLTPGERNIIPFLIHDERGEARISLRIRNFGDWNGGTWTCGLPQAGWIRCEIDWTPQLEHANRRFTLTVEAEGRNVDPVDIEKISKTFFFPVRVKEAPAPPPPAPTPEPGPTEPVPTPEPSPENPVTPAGGPR